MLLYYELKRALKMPVSVDWQEASDINILIVDVKRYKRGKEKARCSPGDAVCYL